MPFRTSLEDPELCNWLAPDPISWFVSTVPCLASWVLCWSTKCRQQPGFVWKKITISDTNIKFDQNIFWIWPRQNPKFLGCDQKWLDIRWFGYFVELSCLFNFHHRWLILANKEKTVGRCTPKVSSWFFDFNGKFLTFRQNIFCTACFSFLSFSNWRLWNVSLRMASRLSWEVFLYLIFELLSMFE